MDAGSRWRAGPLNALRHAEALATGSVRVDAHALRRCAVNPVPKRTGGQQLGTSCENPFPLVPFGSQCIGVRAGFALLTNRSKGGPGSGWAVRLGVALLLEPVGQRVGRFAVGRRRGRRRGWRRRGPPLSQRHLWRDVCAFEAVRAWDVRPAASSQDAECGGCSSGNYSEKDNASDTGTFY